MYNLHPISTINLYLCQMKNRGYTTKTLPWMWRRILLVPPGTTPCYDCGWIESSLLMRQNVHTRIHPGSKGNEYPCHVWKWSTKKIGRCELGVICPTSRPTPGLATTIQWCQVKLRGKNYDATLDHTSIVKNGKQWPISNSDLSIHECLAFQTEY